MTAPATPMSATITESPDRISAVDADGVEICGAFRPTGHAEWRIYATRRLTSHTHFVISPTQQVARWHIEMLLEMFVRAEQ